MQTINLAGANFDIIGHQYLRSASHTYFQYQAVIIINHFVLIQGSGGVFVVIVVAAAGHYLVN